HAQNLGKDKASKPVEASHLTEKPAWGRRLRTKGLPDHVGTKTFRPRQGDESTALEGRRTEDGRRTTRER
ncbi:MAG: hypothetical protein ACC645_07075, partial [Pirellulales bacterium]